ncbi:MAG TPA: SRPBCC domain-containing protein [Acidimicrobiales bacterium]|nr:SRPBCC domain-containing protein [Acidimicrobiales bacterium]
MTNIEAPAVPTTQVYSVYIKATPEAIWQAITDPEWTNRYGYGGYARYDLREGGAYRHEPNAEMKAGAEAMGFPCPDVIIDGEVIEVDPPRLLKQTWRFLMDPAAAAEGPTTVTYEIRPIEGGYCALTVTHECEGAPTVALMIANQLGDGDESTAGGGHAWILSDLKTLLETGTKMVPNSPAAE